MIPTSSLPPLPQGFVLDTPALPEGFEIENTALPPLPDGFELEQPLSSTPDDVYPEPKELELPPMNDLPRQEWQVFGPDVIGQETQQFGPDVIAPPQEKITRAGVMGPEVIGGEAEEWQRNREIEEQERAIEARKSPEQKKAEELARRRVEWERAREGATGPYTSESPTAKGGEKAPLTSEGGGAKGGEIFEADVYRGEIKGDKNKSIGEFYTIEQDRAKLYADFKKQKTGGEPSINKERIRLENPLRIPEEHIDAFELLQKDVPELKTVLSQIYKAKSDTSVDNAIVKGEQLLQKYARKQGYDGIVFGKGEIVIKLSPKEGGGIADRVYYHRTNKDFSAKDIISSKGGALGEGIYLSKGKDDIPSFGKNVLEFKLSPDTKLLKIPFNETVNKDAWVKRAKDEGYDGVDTDLGEIVIFNKSKLSPKETAKGGEIEKTYYHASYTPLSGTPKTNRGAFYLSETPDGAKAGGRAGNTLPEAGISRGVPKIITQFNIGKDSKIFGEKPSLGDIELPNKLDEVSWDALKSEIEHHAFSDDLLINNKAKTLAFETIRAFYSDDGVLLDKISEKKLKSFITDWDGFEYRDDRNNKQNFIEALKALGYDGAYVSDEGGKSLAILNTSKLSPPESAKGGEITVYRGTRDSEKRFEGEHYSEDKSFAKKFGEVKEYKINTNNVLDITDINTVRKLFGEDIAKSFESGNFWQSIPDKDGFTAKPIDKVIAYAKEQGYSGIKYIENFSRDIRPTNYLMLSKLSPKEGKIGIREIQNAVRNKQ